MSQKNTIENYGEILDKKVSEWSIPKGYEDIREVAVNFLNEECKKLPAAEREILLNKIVDKLIWFEKEKNNIITECKSALEEMKSQISTFKTEKGTEGELSGDIFGNEEFIIMNQGLIKDSPELRNQVLNQLKQKDNNLFEAAIKLDSKENNIEQDFEYTNYKKILGLIQILKSGKSQQLIQIEKNISNGNDEEAIENLNDNFSSNELNDLLNFEYIKKVRLIERAPQIDKLHRIFSDKGISKGNENLIDSGIGFSFPNIPVNELSILLDSIDFKPNCTPEEYIKGLENKGVDIGNINNFTYVIYQYFGRSDEHMDQEGFYLDVFKISKKQISVTDNKLVGEKELNTSAIRDLNFDKIFNSDKETIRQKKVDFEKLLLQHTKISNDNKLEFTNIKELKEGLSAIFNGTEIADKIEKGSAKEILDIIVSYCDGQQKELAMELKQDAGFDEAKMNSLSEEELNELINLIENKEEFILSLSMKGIINKEIFANLDENTKANVINQLKNYLNFKIQKKLGEKTLASPDRLILMDRVLKGDLVEGSEAYNEEMYRIRKTETKVEIDKQIEKNKEKFKDIKDFDMDGDIDMYDLDIHDAESHSEFIHIKNHPNTYIKKTGKGKVEIVFESGEIVNCNSKDAKNLLDIGTLLEDIGLGFLINSIPRSGNLNIDLVKALGINSENKDIDFMNGLEPGEIRMFLETLCRSIFGPEIPLNLDKKDYIAIFKNRGSMEGENSMQAILDKKNIYKNGKFNRQGFINLLNTKI